MKLQALFSETQYLGRNRFWLTRRTVIAIFCFLAYFFTEEREQNGDLFLVVGAAIIVVSILLLFVRHFKTSVFTGSVVIDGTYTARRVKIDIRSLKHCEKIPYSNFMLNNPVYNLHKNNTIRFYTRGKEAVKLEDHDGLVYIIGTQKPEELYQAVQNQL